MPERELDRIGKFCRMRGADHHGGTVRNPAATRRVCRSCGMGAEHYIGFISALRISPSACSRLQADAENLWRSLSRPLFDKAVVTGFSEFSLNLRDHAGIPVQRHP